MAAPVLPCVAVADMHFDHRERHGLDGIVQRHAVLREAGWIQQCAVRRIDVLVEKVNELAFVIRLEGDDLGAEFLAQLLELLQYLGERGGAVDMRLAPAEQVQIRAVQDEDLNRFFQFLSRLETSAGLRWHSACSRA